MISKNMQELIKKSEGISSLFSDARKLKQQYGAENVYDFGIGILMSKHQKVSIKQQLKYCNKKILYNCIVIQIV